MVNFQTSTLKILNNYKKSTKTAKNYKGSWSQKMRNKIELILRMNFGLTILRKKSLKFILFWGPNITMYYFPNEIPKHSSQCSVTLHFPYKKTNIALKQIRNHKESSLQFSFPKNATKIWQNLPVDLTFTMWILNQLGDFVKLWWPF